MIEQPGVFVAFDRFGVHFAYARHPDSQSCTGRVGEQAERLKTMTAEAALRGGKVIHFSLEAFDRLILFNAGSGDNSSQQHNKSILKSA